jgi:hypothetical protein
MAQVNLPSVDGVGLDATLGVAELSYVNPSDVSLSCW